MNIFILQERNPFYINNASANRWRTMIEGLSRNGADLTLIILDGYSSKLEFERFGETGNMDNGITYLYLNSQKNYSIHWKRINKYVFGRWFNFINAYRFRHFIQKEKPNFILFNSSFVCLNLLKSIDDAIFTGTKLVLEINEYIDILEQHVSNKLQRNVVKNLIFILKRDIFPKIDICVVMTMELFKFYSSFENLKSNIQFLHLPMTVDINRFDEQDIETFYQKPYICYCGSSSFYKDGVDILIKSFELIAEKHIGFHLNLAVFWEIDGPKMLNLIDKSRFKDRIHYLGTLDRLEVTTLIKNSSLCVLPRPDTRQARGGFPTKLGEYLASGVPVCATRVGEIPDYLTDNESTFFAEPGSIESFASAMDRALSNPDLAQMIGSAGRRVAKEHFSMDVQVKKLFGFLSQNHD